MSEPIRVHVYKSDDGSEKVRGAVIRVTAALPRFNPKELAHLDAQYHADAEALEDVLWRSLPGGTYDRLLGLMLSRKASHFRVSFCDALDQGSGVVAFTRGNAGHSASLAIAAAAFVSAAPYERTGHDDRAKDD